MYKRIETYRTHKHGAQLDMGTTTEGGTGATQWYPTKKLLVSLVLLMQIGLIGCLWLLQLDGGDPTGAVVEVVRSTDYKNNKGYAGERVNFIKKAVAPGMQQSEEKSFKLKAGSNFRKDFYLKPKLWCFREGTLSISGKHGDSENDDLLQLGYEQCNCLPDWHGKDCGQPEIIWRTLMAAKTPFKLMNPFKDPTHQLVLMLEGNFFNMDLLELQVKTIEEAVDYFIIYLRNTKAQFKEIKALERKLKELLKRGNYLIFHCNNFQATNVKENCTSAHAYKYFRNKLEKTMQLKPTDLFVYTHDHELLSRHALKFLKYYAADIQIIRFRLKYTVYGFYWQHPERTHLGGFISSFVHLDNPQSGNADPVQLLLSIDMPATGGRDSNALVIGDLNHFGGWFCKYCQQPDDIIAELHAELSSLRHVQFPNDTRSRHIDAPYLQKLIANGIYIDGKTQLLKLRHNTDKHYAPVYAEQKSWKFGNLLVNLFESFDEDIEDEVGLY